MNITQCSSRWRVTYKPAFKVPKTGSYKKRAIYLLSYGVCTAQAAKMSKLGLRRTKVIARELKAIRKEMAINIDEKIQRQIATMLTTGEYHE